MSDRSVYAPMDDDAVFPLANESLQNAVSAMQAIAITVGTLSFLASLTVIATALAFPSMWHNKIYMQMIVMISVYDSIASLAVTFGFPTNGLCSLQGSMVFFGFRGAWMWSVFMLHQLTYILKHGEVYASFKTMNIVSLTVNVVFEFLPFITKTFYTAAKAFRGRMICSFDFYDKHFFDWICVVFVGPLNTTVTALMIGCVILFFRVKSLGYNPDRRPDGSGERKSINLVYSVVMYPVMMLLSTLPFVFVFFKDINIAPSAQTNDFQQKYIVWELIYSWTSMQGFFNACIFFFNSAEARHRWRKWFKVTCPALCVRTADPKAAMAAQEFEVDGVAPKRDFSSFLMPGSEDFLSDEAMAEMIQKETSDRGRFSENSYRGSRFSRGGAPSTLSETTVGSAKSLDL